MSGSGRGGAGAGRGDGRDQWHDDEPRDGGGLGAEDSGDDAEEPLFGGAARRRPAYHGSDSLYDERFSPDGGQLPGGSRAYNDGGDGRNAYVRKNNPYYSDDDDDDDEAGVEEYYTDAQGGRVPVHPSKRCILSSFGVLLVMLITLFFALGFSVHRPMIGALFVAAIVPSLLILFLAVRNRGYTDAEVPLEVMLVGFGHGVLVTIPVGVLALCLQMLAQRTLYSHFDFVELVLFLAFEAYVMTACLEEGAKYVLATSAIGRDLGRYIRHPYGVVVFGMSCALGFAALENVTYVMDEKTEASGWQLAIMRAVLAVPLHATTGTLIGVGLAARRFGLWRGEPGRDQPSWWRVMTLPVLVHGTYDYVFVLPLRNGGFSEKTKNHALHRSDNTRDIGDLYDLLMLANMVFVFVMVVYTSRRVNSLCDDFEDEQLARYGRRSGNGGSGVPAEEDQNDREDFYPTKQQQGTRAIMPRDVEQP